MRNNGLNSLLAGFNQHISMPQGQSQQFTLEDIREYMRRQLACTSPNFAFGQYTSVSNILLHLLKTSTTVLVNTRRCTVHEHNSTQESTISTAMVVVLGECNGTLQQKLNELNIVLSSRCGKCNSFQVKSTTFQSFPPLLAFEWGTQPPVLNPTLIITGQHAQTTTYHLRGIVYHDTNHFTAHIIDGTGWMWYHDGMQTGAQRTLTLEQRGTSPYANAIVAVYSRG
jgi:hypothetical protein